MLVKGCGKGTASAEVRELDGSNSPDTKSSTETSPVVAAA